MPLFSETPSRPIEVEGRKRKPTRRVIENGDPLVNKRAKIKRTRPSVATTTQSQSSITSARTSNVHASPPSARPSAQPRAPDGADGDEDETMSERSELAPIEVSDGEESEDSVQIIEEDDDAELSECWHCFEGLQSD